MQAVAAEFSGYAENSAAFWERTILKHFVSSFISKKALKQARSVCIRYLTRNKRVDAYGCEILRVS